MPYQFHSPLVGRCFRQLRADVLLSAFRQPLNNATSFPRLAELPSGYPRLPGNRNTDGSFNNLGSNFNVWSSTPSGASNAWNRNLNSSYSTVNRNANSRANGFSVCCLSTDVA